MFVCHVAIQDSEQVSEMFSSFIVVWLQELLYVTFVLDMLSNYKE